MDRERLGAMLGRCPCDKLMLMRIRDGLPGAPSFVVRPGAFNYVIKAGRGPFYNFSYNHRCYSII